jgi:hypothetical protein
MTVIASSDYIAQFMPDQPNAVQLHTICTEVALVHLGGGVAPVEASSGGAQLSVSYKEYSVPYLELAVINQRNH